MNSVINFLIGGLLGVFFALILTLLPDYITKQRQSYQQLPLQMQTDTLWFIGEHK